MLPLPEIEKKILNFWKENQIFEKSLQKEAPKGDYVFYDGPPFATGTPHYGHLVASLMKDIVPRYQTMRGYHVERKWGWDCHGMPIENIVEEKLGLKTKKDIEKIGIDKFNEFCRQNVLTYVEEWRKVIERWGRWVDMDNAYKTMDLTYMESVWWVFKELWDKKLIYEGYKAMHICPRCETTLSQYEVSEGYKDVTDLAVTAKFELADEPNVYILAWTTTPWTLIGNVALAIGENIEYVKFRLSNHPDQLDGVYIASKNYFEKYQKVIAENPDLASVKLELLEQVAASKLVGRRYQPLFDYYLNKPLEHKENLYTIQSANFVTTEDGTGVVHIAPAFGEEDMTLGLEKNLPFIQHVGMDGRFKEEVKDFAGLDVKPRETPTSTDEKVIDFLKKKNLIFEVESYTHSYPYCWRCDSPLLNYATSSLFVNVTALKSQLLKNAEFINWVPAHIKEGRFGKWLEGARDWAISRQRYWGSVIPLWICDQCGEKKVIGSVKELEDLTGAKITDLHKHFIDKLQFKCEKCGGTMKRIPDVLDCWFESGSMPYAQLHYPFENKEKFEKNFPAEFIAEGVDQTRAWFYYLHVLATALKDKPAFKNVVVNGIVLAEDGKKMSKHLKNYTDPLEMMEKYGADPMRYYLATSPVVEAEDLWFSEKAVEEILKKVILILLNVLSFYKLYVSAPKISLEMHLGNVLDVWIISRLETLKEEVTMQYEQYNLAKANRPIAEFIEDLSTWYVRRSRERFKNGDEEAMHTLGYILLELAKVMAPVMPFVSDYIYKEIGGEKVSIHLEDWPTVNKNLINPEVLEKMKQTRKAVEIGLALRSEHQIKIRQPLKLIQFSDEEMFNNLYEDVVKEELNVKEIALGEKDWLDTEITPELEEEGILRELTRSVNQLRKERGLKIDEKNVILEYETSEADLKALIGKSATVLKKNCLLKEIVMVQGLPEAKTMEINGKEIKFNLKY
ncbi:MAG TPA: isoleucine--tRNA ligase [Candidatus Paceibacterota bacterium]|nr:isoleucine--tRNA ligase [Candidatus Paceibacterota bacterium]HOL54055.1 isoleucine--tRNA ligase [Candidatus Paceibacterota bacterium]HPP17116.1 isoleucine--tRNA ligase [Candidatus Paceibacterota bacterium]